MVLLLFALGIARVREPVSRCADFLLSHLSLLFVPVAVGVMAYLPLLRQYGVRLLVVLVVSTWIGLTATLIVYLLTLQVYTALGQAPWANPVLWSVVALSSGLLLADVAYPVYFSGAQFIHFLLGPAVVALAWPLWQRRHVVRCNWLRLLAASLLGPWLPVRPPWRSGGRLGCLAKCFCR